MSKNSKVVCAAMALLLEFSVCAKAAPGDVTLEIFGADWGVTSHATGFFHAFMCIEYQLNSGIKEDCFGFYPDTKQIRQIGLNTGDSLRSSDSHNWVESGGSFRFVTQNAPCDLVQLFDSTRNLTLRLPIYGGQAEITWPGHPWGPFGVVTSVDFANNPLGLIVGPGVVSSEYCRNATRFSLVSATFKHNIDTNQRAKILSTMQNWNGHHYNIATSNCIDFVDSLAGVLGINRPPRQSTQTPMAYVQGLISLNP